MGKHRKIEKPEVNPQGTVYDVRKAPGEPGKRLTKMDLDDARTGKPIKLQTSRLRFPRK